jgi:hypothetical protein
LIRKSIFKKAAIACGLTLLSVAAFAQDDMLSLLDSVGTKKK